jgi:magnesium transporter
LTFKKPEPVAGKIKSSTSPRDRRRRKGDKSKRAAGDGIGEMGEVNDEEQAQGSENDVLWAVGDASDDEDEGEDEDENHHQHPLHQDLPKARIAGGSPNQRRSSRRAVNERTGLVTSEDEGDSGDYMDGSRLLDMNRKRSMDPFRDDDERHEMHNVAGEVNGRPLR